jgi:hypothetical protein
MADEKGSDLDVFEGLTKKKKNTLAPSGAAGATSAPPAGDSIAPPGASAPPPAASIPAAKLPPPKKTLIGMSLADEAMPAIPKAAPPPRKPASAPPAGSDLDDDLMPEATAEMRRPTKQEIEQLMRGEKPGEPEAPAAAPEPAAASDKAAVPSLQVVAEGESEGADADSSVPPAEVSAVALEEEGEGLDWDDENESTSVFGKKHAEELFGDLGERPTTPQAESAPPERKAAAALLAGSSKSVTISPAAGLSASPFDGLPKIPAPAPVPREIVASHSFDSAPAPAASNAPTGWGPSVPPVTEPKPQSKSNLWIGVVAALVLGLGVFFFLRSSGPGTLLVRVEHRGKSVDTAQVFVDGQQVCTFTPCRVKNVDPGKRDVRVASGVLAAQSTVEVRGGSGETELTIQLGVGNDGPEPPVMASAAPTAESDAAKGPAGLSLKTAIADKVKVFVDGQEKGILPLELKDLKPGNVTVRFEPAGDKYGKLEKTYVLEAGKTLAVDDIKLPLKVVAVTFKLETAGATVRLEEAGKPASPLPFLGASVEKKLDTSAKWKVLASLKGHRDFEQAIVFEDDKPTLMVSIKLDKQDEPAPATAADTPSTAPKSAPAAAESTPAAAPAAEGGTISANSIPPSSVLIDGRPHGQTPVTGVRVSAGSHTVTFKHKDYGVQSRSVTVAPGKSATATVKFDTKKK